MKKYLLLTLTLALAAPVLAKDMPYENGKLIDVDARHQQEQNYDYSHGLTHAKANGQYDKAIPVVTVAVDNIEYQGECPSYWNRNPFRDMIAGNPVEVKFDGDKRHYFVIKKEDGKDSTRCRVLSKRALDTAASNKK